MGKSGMEGDPMKAFIELGFPCSQVVEQGPTLPPSPHPALVLPDTNTNATRSCILIINENQREREVGQAGSAFIGPPASSEGTHGLSQVHPDSPDSDVNVIISNTGTNGSLTGVPLGPGETESTF